MSAMYLRGGIPRHINGTTDNPAAVEMWTWNKGGVPGGVANYLWFQNTGTGAIILSFSEDDATAGLGISIASGADYLIPAECSGFWTKSVAAETFQAVAFLRRG